MTTYFNERTGDRVELDGRSARLDSLDNWTRLGDDKSNPPVVDDGILSRPSLVSPGSRRAPGRYSSRRRPRRPTRCRRRAPRQSS